MTKPAQDPELVPSSSEASLKSVAQEVQVEELHRPGPFAKVGTFALRYAEVGTLAPIESEERLRERLWSNASLWFGMNATIAAFSTGILGPLVYGLSLPSCTAVIILFNLFSCSVPAYISIMGPRLGLRQMVIARYSFGRLFSIIPALLNVITFIGFCAVNAIVGGQTLSALNPDGGISVNAGIAVISVVGLLIALMGYRTLHVFEQFVWIPVTISFIILIAVSGTKLMTASAFAATTATPALVLSFGTLIVGFSLTWSGCISDFNTYLPAKVSGPKLFLSTFLSLYIGCVSLQIIGAAFGAAALSGQVPQWTEAFGGGNVGALIGVALIERLGGFGKLLTLIIALGIISNQAPTIYAFSVSAQVVIPASIRWQYSRFFYSFLCFAIFLPIAIVGAQNFSAALSNFLGILGYWIAIFLGVILPEHLLFRRADFANYNISDWDTKGRLPKGYAAGLACACGVVMVGLSMDQVYWRGPIAAAIGGPGSVLGGDLGFELALIVTSIVYIGARIVELKVWPAAQGSSLDSPAVEEVLESDPDGKKL